MAKTSVMTLRIDPLLLAAVKARAKRLGRSASAEVVYVLRRDLSQASTASAPTVRPVMGMFSGFDAMDAGAFRRAREQVGQHFLEAATKMRST